MIGIKTRCAPVVASLFLLCPNLTAATVRIRVTDPAGVEGVRNVLVIIRSLDGKGEISRELSDQQGVIGPVDASPGLYEAIATFPYGYWHTQAREFLASNDPVQIEMHLDGSTENVVYPEVTLDLRVVDVDGRPASGAWLVGRNLDASDIHVVKADQQGRAELMVPTDGAEVTAIYNGHSQTQRVDIDSHIRDCRLADKCLAARIEELKRLPHRVTVQLQ